MNQAVVTLKKVKHNQPNIYCNVNSDGICICIIQNSPKLETIYIPIYGDMKMFFF